MATPVEQIKDRLSIIDVVSPYVELHKAGRHFKGKSPFTTEKTPSFFVSPDRGMYYCFSSSKGGDIFTFIQEMEGVDFKGALKILAERAGVELTPEDPKRRTEREQLYSLLEEATVFFETKYRENALVIAYVTDRGVSKETAKVWRIGYAPDEWRSLKEYLSGKGFSESMQKRAGLIKEADGGKSPYDVFRNRIMFPIMDNSGRVVAFSGRALASDPNTPKYVNSPETELYQKSEILFGYDKARHGIRTYDFALIVEGQFDLVLSHQAGYSNTVAISGTALTPHHVGLLNRLTERAVLALDADSAGINSAKRSSEIMLRRGMDVKVARIVGGKDPADLVKEDPKLLKEAVGKGKHIIEFLLTLLQEESKDERNFRLRVREEVLPFVICIPNHIDRDHFEGIVAELLKTTKDAVHYEVERLSESDQDFDKNIESDKSSIQKGLRTREEGVAKHLMGILIWQEASEKQILNVEKLKTYFVNAVGEDTFDSLMSIDDKEKNKLLFEIEAQYEDYAESAINRELRELLKEVGSKYLISLLQKARGELKRAEEANDTKEVQTLLEKCNGLQKELSEIEDGYGESVSFMKEL